MSSPDYPSWNAGGQYEGDPAYGYGQDQYSPYASTDSGLPYGYAEPQQAPYGAQPMAPQSMYAPMPYPTAARKDPAMMLLASFFIPGLGTMLNGEGGKGAGILIGYIASWVLLFVFVGLVGIFGFWIWGMVDAYQGAINHNRRNGIYH